jgi:N-acetylneuraminic acid mutarotase
VGLALALVLPIAAATEGPIGVWLPGPPMTEHPDYHLALVLKDSRVLILGLRAEVYDPVANRWSPAGTPAVMRGNQTATLLRDGRVLVTGGIDGTTGRSVPTAELYDPVANTWALAASMAGRRYAHTATLLPDGRVLIVGGTRSAVVLDSTEIYDPASNRWSPGPSLPAPRSDHGAALLPDGRVLVAGGDDGSQTLASAEFFDPTANRWSSTSPMTTGRHSVDLIPLNDGRVMAVAGLPGPGPQPGEAAEIFDPIRETWSVAGSSTQPLLTYGEASVLLKDGRVFVSGGPSQTYMGDALSSGYVYDPRTDRWVATNPMAQGRVSHSASLLPDGRVLVAGGRDAQSNGRGLNTTEIFNVNAKVIPSPGTMAGTTVASSSATATPLQSLASGLPATPLLAAGIAVLVIALVATWVIRRRPHRRRRRRI